MITFLTETLWSVKHWTGITLAVSTITTKLLDPYAKSPFSDLSNKQKMHTLSNYIQNIYAHFK